MDNAAFDTIDARYNHADKQNFHWNSLAVSSNIMSHVAESFDSCLKIISVEVVSLRVGSLYTGTSGELWTTRVFSAREWFEKRVQELSQLTPLTSLFWIVWCFRKSMVFLAISKHFNLTLQVLSTVGFIRYHKKSFQASSMVELRPPSSNWGVMWRKLVAG